MGSRKKLVRKIASVGLAVWVAGLAFIFYPRREPAQVPSFSAPDLPKRAMDGSLEGRRVRVLLRYPLTFESDPLVGVYSPSQEGTMPPTMEFHFDSPPGGRVLSVTGTVSGIRFDNLPRWNRVPGCLVMVACEVDRSRP